MKGYANFYKIALLGVCLWVTVSYVQRIFHAVTAVRYVAFAFDSQLSVAACHAIEQWSSLFEVDGMYNVPAMLEHMALSFPVIKSVECTHFPPHVALIAITAFEPLVRINEDRLLIENQSLCAADYYAIYKNNSLQKITVAAPLASSVSASIMNAMKECLAEKIFDHYTVYLAHEHAWYLHDGEDALFTLCCDAASLPIDNLKTAYIRLKNEIKKRGPAQVKWIADMRFHDQIILSRDKGGRYG